jgi:enoyl-CoA hydratase/carnithine racemase
MAYANITLARDGAVARLILNRPDRRNALTHAMMLELEDAFATIRDDQSCRAVVLRGAGGHFCAGGDLDAMADMPPEPGNGSPDPLVAAYRQFGNALMALNHLPQPTIAIVEGSAVGGGLCTGVRARARGQRLHKLVMKGRRLGTHGLKACAVFGKQRGNRRGDVVPCRGHD